MTTERITRNQSGALEAINQHGTLRSGWGGYSQATMASLARRGLARASLADDRRFSITARGQAVLREQYVLGEYAGAIDATVCPETGTLVVLLDGEEAGLDTDGGRWSTLCDEHDEVIAHDSLTNARGHHLDPLGWCEECMAKARGHSEAEMRSR